MTVQPGTARWTELVREGIIRDGNRNWFLGDAALEIAPMGPSGVRSGEYANLDQYAQEIGVNADSLRLYRDVANSWPAPTRVGATCWKVHQQLMGHKDLIKPKMTVTQAADALGQKNVGRTGPKADVKARAAAAAEYMNDPDVVDELMKSREARSNAMSGIHRHDRRQDQERGWQPQPPPAHSGSLAEVNLRLSTIRHELRLIHEDRDWIQPKDRPAVAQSLENIAGQARTVADIVRDPSSVTISDAELQDLLKDGQS